MTTNTGAARPVYISARALAERWGTTTVSLWRWRQLGILPEPELIGLTKKAWPIGQIESIEAQRAERAAR